METFELSNFTEKTAELLHDAREAFERNDLPTDALPSVHTEDDEAIKLVFVGQYSAGKSSIIKMLTGIDTGIGAGIQTQKSHAYAWNGIDIIDTPGIQTGVHPDHDEITYHEIDHAALLIFVITNEGFDQTMGEHFRKLAIEGQRGANMILVINKMDRAAQGNSPEQQAVMCADIERVIAPFSMEQLYTSFISTDRYEEALAETDDEEFRQELMDESGYETFLANLNAFVRAKHVAARLEKPLYELAAAIDGVVGTEKEQHALEGAEELAKRKLRILRDGRARCASMLQDIALTCQSDIGAIGRRASLSIQAGAEEAAVQQALPAAQAEVKQRIQRCTQDMDQAFQNTLAGISKEFDEQLRSPFAKQVRAELETSGALVPADGADGLGARVAVRAEAVHLAQAPGSEGGRSLGQGLDIARKVGDQVAKHAIKEGSELAGNVAKNGALGGFADVVGASLKGFSGSGVHSFVKGAGHLFDVKFAPWEALKITKGIAVFGKVLGVVGALYSLYSAFTAGDKAKEAEQKIRAARDEVRQNFQAGAAEVYGQLMQAAEAQLAQRIDPVIKELEGNVQAFEDRKAHIAAYAAELGALGNRERALLQEIQEADGATAKA